MELWWREEIVSAQTRYGRNDHLLEVAKCDEREPEKHQKRESYEVKTQKTQKRKEDELFAHSALCHIV